jgi:hypothetical protein
MRLLSRFMLCAAVAVAACAFASTAGAADVTVGPSLSGSWEPYSCGAVSCTYVNGDLAGAGANQTSPVTGAIVGFSVIYGETAGTYRIRTANRAGATTFSFAKLSAPVTAIPNAGIQSYPISLPITAGQTVGLTTNETASVGFQAVGRAFEWETELPETGSSAAEENYPEIAGFNVTIQPAPTIAALSATTGSTTGGTPVTITGTDLDGASAVTFGGTPAPVTADTETQLTVVAPASAAAAAVPVVVTTVAGAATSAQQFTYVVPPAPAPKVQCVVPNLAGKKLAAAKTALTKAHCALGKVKKLAGATAGSGKVSKQGSKAGTKLASGSKVAVTLKPAKPAGKKHKK